MREYPELEYCFGKVTTYPPMGHESRDLLLTFLEEYFPGKTNSRRVSHVHPQGNRGVPLLKASRLPQKTGCPLMTAIGQITDYLKDKGVDCSPPCSTPIWDLTPRAGVLRNGGQPCIWQGLRVRDPRSNQERSTRSGKSQFIDNYESINPGGFSPIGGYMKKLLTDGP
jgi:hypothetical protein